MRANYLKLTAVFIAALVVSIPFYSSYVFALIQKNSISGQNKIDGYRMRDDFTIINITSSTDNIRVEGDLFNFFNCTMINTSLYDCVYSKWSSLGPGISSYKVSLYSGSEPTGESEILNISVDALPPAINTFNIVDLDDNLQLEYELLDYAFDSTIGKCSGLSKVELVDEEERVLHSLDINQSAPYCGYYNLLTIPNPVPLGSAAEKEFCLRAYDMLYSDYSIDRLDHFNESCITMMIDRKNPLVNCDLHFTKNGVEVESVSTTGSYNEINDVRIDVEIIDDNLTGVSADFSELTTDPMLKSVYSNIQWPGSTMADCANTNNQWNCSYYPVQLDLISDTVNLTIIATDNDGNVANVTCYKTFNVDNDAPVTTFVGSEKVDEAGVSYVNKGLNNIIATFDEDTGFYNNNVFFDVHSLNSVLTMPRRAFKCELNNTWKCVLPVNVVSDNEGMPHFVALAFPSADDLGNAVTPLSNNLILDSVKPEVNNVSLSTPCVTSSEILQMVFNITEETSGVKSINVNASKISTYPGLFEGNCSKVSSSLWQCTVEINYITSSPVQADVPVFIIDYAGNVNNYNVSVEVCRADPNTTPNFVSASFTVIPDEIDRRLASYYEVPVIVFLNISLDSGRAEIINLEHDNCRAIYNYLDPEQDPYFVSDIDLNHPIMELKLFLDEEALAEDYFTIDCNLSMKMRSGNTVFLNPEVERLVRNVSLVDWPLGAADESMGEKINAVKKELQDLDKEIEKKQKKYDFLEKMESFARFFINLLTPFYVGKAVLWGLFLGAWLVCTVFGCTGFIDKVWKPVCNYSDIIYKIVNGFIWTPGMNIIGVGWLFKWAVMFYNCALCDYESHLGIILDKVGVEPKTAYTIGGAVGGAVSGEYFFGTLGGVGGAALGGSSGYVEARYDPSKSLKVAKTCMCVPGVLYGLKKQRQIDCLYLKCL
ncbi:hypothetical protein D6745_02760, partial [Candidatus Woesearchaeota archaeon]